MPQETSSKVKTWFSEFVTFLTTHQYGIDEMSAKNNHGTCWVMQVGMFARLVGNDEVLDLCRNRFKNVLLPGQMAADASFPLELKRKKPYGYSLFNLDAFMVTAEILSDKENNLFEFTTPNGLNLQLGAAFLFPYVKDKSTWPYPPDVMYFNEWPVRQPFLLFAGIAYNKPEYIDLWLTLEGYPKTPEVIRNLPIRNPLIWLMDAPIQK